MNSVELVKTICKGRNIPISRLERECNFANGYIGKLREGKFPSDRLKVIADYLDVSVEYLLTGTDGKKGDVVQPYYTNEYTARLAQEMFDDPDMRALFHMKKNMDAKKFSAHMQMMKELYRLEHPEEYQGDDGC